MTVAIHQPEHLPWYGFFHKIAHADRFVLLDVVQFKKNYFENRNRVLGKNGLQWLTVPVRMKGHLDKRFYEMETEPTIKWKKKYIRTLHQTYNKAPFFGELEPLIAFLEDWESQNLADLNIGIIEVLCDILSIDKSKLVRASNLDVGGKSTDLLIAILTQEKADTYLMGKSGYDYIDKEKFDTANVAIRDHCFRYPDYNHFIASAFPEEKPSIIDMIASAGKKFVSESLNERSS